MHGPHVNMMGLRKLLSIFRAKSKLPLRETQQETRFFLPQKIVAPTKITMLPPTPIQKLQSCTPEPALIPEEPSRQKTSETEDEELCEQPRPMEEFHAVSVEVASEKAAEKGLVILFKEIDKCELFGRRRVYFGLTQEFTEKLLRCTIDIKPIAEFTPAETIILNALVARKWLRKIQDGKTTYYYGLSERTADNLQKQLSEFNNPAY